MKNLFLLAGLLLTLFSCSDELQFNEHALQATKDSELWKASDFSITISEEGFLNLRGTYKNDVFNLNIESTEPGVYNMGEGSNTTAWYRNDEGKAFTTEYLGNGEVVINGYNAESQTYSGTFKFNAFSSDREVANFINGVFYQVPVVFEDIIEEEGELKASVDDSELEADEVTALNTSGMIEVQGMSADGSFIKLYIPENTPVGSYNLNELSASGTYAVYGYPNGTTSTAQYGTLFINEHNIASKRIKGTFTFTTLLPNSVSVENGNFTAYY